MTQQGAGTKLGALDLTEFKPKSGRERRPTAEEIDQTATLPRRDPIYDRPGDGHPPKKAQIGIHYREDVILRFKEMAKADRRDYGDMLEVLMDFYDKHAELR